MSRRPWLGATTMLVMLGVCVPSLDAQTRTLEFDRPESWAMKFSTSVALFSGFGTPPALESGEFEVAAEFSNIPQLSTEKRRVGFDGTKVEDMNKSPVFARLRARVGVGGGWSAEVGVVPPVTADGAQPLMFAAALGGPLHETDVLRFGLRAHGQLGRVQGDITCDAETVAAGIGSSANPFGCEAVSEDEAVHRYGGLELSVSSPQGSWEPYLTVTGNVVSAEFRVNALYSGTTSTEILKTNGSTIAGSIGSAIALGSRARLNVEGFVSPLSVVRPPDTNSNTEVLFNVRALVSYQLR